MRTQVVNAAIAFSRGTALYALASRREGDSVQGVWFLRQAIMKFDI